MLARRLVHPSAVETFWCLMEAGNVSEVDTVDLKGLVNLFEIAYFGALLVLAWQDGGMLVSVGKRGRGRGVRLWW